MLAITLARHVEAATRLLQELEQQSAVARDALDRDESGDFLAAITERDRILEQLDEVVAAVVASRSASKELSAEAKGLLTDLAKAASMAMQAQEALHDHVNDERDRTAVAIERGPAPDRPSRYTVPDAGARPTLFITG